MNIFVLDNDPRTAAMQHNDKHVVKMILEGAQLLSTAHRILDGTETIEQRVTKTGKTRKHKVWKLNDHRDAILYQATHMNHPCAVWVRESRSNYQWLVDLTWALCDEYYHRYGRYREPKKRHKVEESGLLDQLRWGPTSIDRSKGLTPFPQCMPDQYKVENDPVQAYRNYYLGEKRDFLKYTHREEPSWI
jgi:hypothetical protein